MAKKQKGVIRGINQDNLTSAIGAVGYDIIDNIIYPLVEIRGVWADLYLASLSEYLAANNEEEYKKLFDEFKKQVVARYGLKEGALKCFRDTDSLVLYALIILEDGNPEVVEKALAENKDN